MRNLYPRLAATNLKKNRRFYLPYLLACIVIVALFCIMLTLASDPYLGQMQHGGSVSQVLGFGVFIMALFSAIILFYTNSTFTKQRKREFAIYNILGMEKRHISYVLFWESLYTAAMALFFGLVAAGVFSKLLQLVLVRLIGGEATFGLNIRLMSIGYTVVFFGALFLLLLLNTIRIIHLSNPVQLLRAGSEGEREPRSKWILALLGRGVPCRGLSHFPAHKRGLVRHPEFLPGGHPCHHRHVSHVYRAERRRAQGAAQKPALLL